MKIVGHFSVGLLSLLLVSGLTLIGCDGGDHSDEEGCGEVEESVVLCPVPAIAVAEGDEVDLGTTLHLDARGDDTDFVQWSWSVVAPDGSIAGFFPSAFEPNPTFTPTVEGHYLFLLETVDAERGPSCELAKRLVTVRRTSWHAPSPGELQADLAVERQTPTIEPAVHSPEDTEFFTGLNLDAP